ncbi:unnamed protein product [Amoebophrya sp. A25]|nr:unnamed protein product [Amoebophrya sp. A25]|eukprot:GSA25T00005426001.1
MEIVSRKANYPRNWRWNKCLCCGTLTVQIGDEFNVMHWWAKGLKNLRVKEHPSDEEDMLTVYDWAQRSSAWEAFGEQLSMENARKAGCDTKQVQIMKKAIKRNFTLKEDGSEFEPELKLHESRSVKTAAWFVGTATEFSESFKDEKRWNAVVEDLKIQASLVATKGNKNYLVLRGEDGKAVQLPVPADGGMDVDQDAGVALLGGQYVLYNAGHGNKKRITITPLEEIKIGREFLESTPQASSAGFLSPPAIDVKP